MGNLSTSIIIEGLLILGLVTCLYWEMRRTDRLLEKTRAEEAERAQKKDVAKNTSGALAD